MTGLFVIMFCVILALAVCLAVVHVLVSYCNFAEEEAEWQRDLNKARQEGTALLHNFNETDHLSDVDTADFDEDDDDDDEPGELLSEDEEDEDFSNTPTGHASAVANTYTHTPLTFQQNPVMGVAGHQAAHNLNGHLAHPRHQLVRRDSGQCDDHDMNCLHFFALSNEHAEHIPGLIARELESQRRFNEMKLGGGKAEPNKRITKRKPIAHTQYFVSLGGTYKATSTTTLLHHPTLLEPDLCRSYPLDINARVKQHLLTPLHFAAMNASADFVLTLVKNGAQVNAVDQHGRTPLRLACNSRRADVVRVLLSTEGCVDLPDSEGVTALRSAVFRSDTDSLRAYIQARRHALLVPLEGGAEGDTDTGIHALHVAASFGAIDMLSLLVQEAQVQLDARDALGRTALMYAATKGKWEAVEHLLTVSSTSGRADPNAMDGHGWTALHYAAVATKSDPIKTIDILVAHGALVDAKELRYALTPLHMAAKSGHVDILNSLIEYGADATSRTSDNRTCLCFAAYGSHLDCITALVEKCPSAIRPSAVRERNECYSTNLDQCLRILTHLPFAFLEFAWSILFGFRPCLDLTSCLYKPATPSSTLSPLHLAIRAKDDSVKVVNMLFKAGADINAGIPIEVGSEWFSFLKMSTVTLLSYLQGTASLLDQEHAENEEYKLLYVHPLCFALAFGNADVALRLLQHPTQTCQAGLFQTITILVLAVFMMRLDVALRILFKTPAGIFLLVSCVGMAVLHMCRFMIPAVDAALLREVWTACGGPQLCNKKLITPETLTDAMNFLGKLLRKDKASDDSSPRSGIGKKSDRSPTRTTPNSSSTQSPQQQQAQQRRFADLYKVKKLIGEGSFATVHLVERKADNVQFAAKFIGKFRRKKRVDEKKQMAEVSILTKVRHRNLIGLVDFFETDEHLILVMDLATGGELFTQIEERGSFTEKDAAEIMRQLLEAVDYLHALGIAHRDLKPENVLLKVKDPASDIVITDFGLSRIVDEDDHILHTTCGSPLYVAPEILSRRGYGRPVDLWSLGVITYILLCGYAPFWGEDQPALFEEIVACRYAFEDEDWGQISESAKDLISKLLTVDPEKRLTAAEALKHPWLDVDREVDILPTVKKNLASRRLGKATNAIRVVNRLKLGMRNSKQHISGEKAPIDNENIR
ncbi:hypothetical protein HDU80_008658 [Chytriomyces hyalinus]|nr:hypothetical protein HDU80_008658 [Chytriomyces hyalinus]